MEKVSGTKARKLSPTHAASKGWNWDHTQTVYLQDRPTFTMSLWHHLVQRGHSVVSSPPSGSIVSTATSSCHSRTGLPSWWVSQATLSNFPTSFALFHLPNHSLLTPSSQPQSICGGTEIWRGKAQPSACPDFFPKTLWTAPTWFPSTARDLCGESPTVIGWCTCWTSCRISYVVNKIVSVVYGPIV